MGHWGSCGGRESEAEGDVESAEDIDDDWRWYALPAGGRTDPGPEPGPGPGVKGAGAKAKAGGS